MNIATPHITVRSAAEVELWLMRYVANLVDVPVDSIDPTVPMDRYGVDSAAAIAITGDVGDWLGLQVDPTLPYDHPTLRAVAEELERELQKAHLETMPENGR